MQPDSDTQPLTLPDYLRPGLKLVFIGLNPGLYSARAGKYFARPSNRFWPALSASGLVDQEAKAGDEAFLLERGIGFTDVVKRATAQIADLNKAEISISTRELIKKIEKYEPRVACFIGVTGYRWTFGVSSRIRIVPGPQKDKVGSTHLYALPSTSPANAHFSDDQILEEFCRFKRWLAGLIF